MQDRLGVRVLPDDTVDEVAVAHVALDECDRVSEPIGVEPGARPDEAVEHDHLVPAARERMSDVGADEARSASNDPLPALHRHRDTIRSMIVLVQAAPAYGAIERYLATLARGLEEPAALIYPDVPELAPFEELPV